MVTYKSCNNASLAPSLRSVTEWTHLANCLSVSSHLAKIQLYFFHGVHQIVVYLFPKLQGVLLET
jgi:hypothetical protein